MTARDYVPLLAAAPLKVEGHVVQSGSSARLQLPLCELADGTEIRLPAIVANGARPGPRPYIGATMHGDEAAGAAIVAQLMAGIDPARLAGSIVALPVQHPP